jgi:5-methylcytosine-specific restriction endonuclease McrA
MIFVTIENLLTFAPNIGVLVHREALAATPNKLFEAIKIAYSHMEDKHLLDACCGSCGPLANLGTVTYERYLELLEEIRIHEAGQAAKKKYTAVRRSEFNAERSALVLTMIEAGVPYVCAEAACGVHVGLTVDHVIPLSRGGTDELQNLRFLCRSHNSKKGDRIRA